MANVNEIYDILSDYGVAHLVTEDDIVNDIEIGFANSIMDAIYDANLSDDEELRLNKEIDNYIGYSI